MQLSDITVSLDLARELKAQGFPQESLFYWDMYGVISLPTGEMREIVGEGKIKNNEWFAAPTTSELLGAIPRIDGYGLTLLKLSFQTIVGYKNSHDFWEFPGSPTIDAHCNDKNPANAVAKFYLHLKKQNLLKD